jgi:hypothetical protein
VGTGTSAAGVGVSGPAAAVNGKSPHAGFGPYGDRIPPFKDILNSGAGTGNAMDSINTKRQ